MVETYYAHDRPDISLRRDGSTERRGLNADAWVMKTGIVYGIW
jgi:hypothetical protein